MPNGDGVWRAMGLTNGETSTLLATIVGVDPEQITDFTLVIMYTNSEGVGRTHIVTPSAFDDRQTIMALAEGMRVVMNGEEVTGNH